MPSRPSRRAFLASVGAGGVAATVPDSTRAASASSLRWSRTYPPEEDDNGILVRDVVETSHGFVLLGVNSVGTSSVGWLAGVDDAGHPRWERRLGQPTSWFYAGTPGAENRVFVAGVRNEHRRLSADGYPDPWLVALDDDPEEPTIRWDRTYQPAAPGGISSAITRTDDGLVLAGSVSRDGDETGSHPWVAALDANGTLQWDWRPENPDREGVLGAVATLPDGVVAGGSTGGGSGIERAWIARISNGGALVWSETFDDAPESRIEALARRPSGGVVAVGDRSFGSDDDGVGFLAAIDGDGTRKWEREYSTGDWNWMREVCPASEGYYLLGTREVTDGDRRGAWVIRVDVDGRTRWERLYPSDEYVRGFALHPLADDGILIGGDLLTEGVRGHGWLAQVGGTAPPGSGGSDDWLSVPSLPSVPSWSVPLAAGLGLGIGIERLRRDR